MLGLQTCLGNLFYLSFYYILIRRDLTHNDARFWRVKILNLKIYPLLFVTTYWHLCFGGKKYLTMQKLNQLGHVCRCIQKNRNLQAQVGYYIFQNSSTTLIYQYLQNPIHIKIQYIVNTTTSMLAHSPFQINSSIRPHQQSHLSIPHQVASSLDNLSQPAKPQLRQSHPPTIFMPSQISKKVCVLYTLKMMSSRIIVCTGSFLWANGEKIVIQQALVETLFQKVNQKGNGSYYCFNSYDDQGIRVRVKDRLLSPVKSFEEFSKGILDKLDKKMKQVLEIYENISGKMVLNHSRCSNSWSKKIQLKKQCLSSYKKMNKILKTANLSLSRIQDKIAKVLNKCKVGGQQQKETSLINYFQKIVQTDQISDEPFYQRTVPQSLKFKIQTKICQLSNPMSRQNSQNQTSMEKSVIQKQMAIKRVDPEEMSQRRVVQLNKQIQIIKKIKEQKQFFLDYSLPLLKNQSTHKVLYMQNIPDTLSFYSRNQMSIITENFHFFTNIAAGVNQLHKSGIIHRDLKPQNILMPDLLKMQTPSSSIKIIDFSDSGLRSEPYSDQIGKMLGCTLPYSPIECKYRCEMGVKSPAIDSWSMGVLLFEMLNGRTPQIQNKLWLHLQNDKMYPEFKDGFKKDDFFYSPYATKISNKTGLKWIIQKLVPVLLIKTLKFNPKERLGIECIISISKELEKCMKSFLAIL